MYLYQCRHGEFEVGKVKYSTSKFFNHLFLTLVVENQNDLNISVICVTVTNKSWYFWCGNKTIKITFLSSKVVVQMLTSHVFFRLNTVAHHIANLLQRSMINHGALLRLMIMEIRLWENGKTVTVTVEKVRTVLFY